MIPNSVDNISPYVRIALNHRDSVYLKPRIIFDYELLYLQKGQLIVEVEGEKFYLNPGEILLIKPGKEHSIITCGEKEAWMPHIHFDLFHFRDSDQVSINFKSLKQCTKEEKNSIREDLLSQPPFNFPTVIKVPCHKEILKVLMNIIHLYERKEPLYYFTIKYLVIKIIAMINKGLINGKEVDVYNHNEALENVASYIIAHYNKKIVIGTLARQCCLSPYHFQRLFKKKYSVSPINYKIRYRIEKAKELMLYTPMSISDIAERIGYTNVQSFSKVFKQREGLPPSQYRKNNTSLPQ